MSTSCMPEAWAVRLQRRRKQQSIVLGTRSIAIAGWLTIVKGRSLAGFSEKMGVRLMRGWMYLEPPALMQLNFGMTEVGASRKEGAEIPMFTL